MILVVIVLCLTVYLLTGSLICSISESVHNRASMGIWMFWPIWLLVGLVYFIYSAFVDLISDIKSWDW